MFFKNWFKGKNSVEDVQKMPEIRLADLLACDSDEPLDLITAIQNLDMRKYDRNVPPQDLNEIAKAILEKIGYNAEIVDGMRDGGIDVVGYQNNVRKIGVQCKQWNPKKLNKRISTQEINAFRGSLSSKKIEQGIFITTHYFDDYALKAADDNLILIDRRQLYALLTRFFPQSMSKIAYTQNLEDQANCPNCKEGKLFKLYREKQSNYDWCESCRGVPGSRKG
ncbi:restriction endonuclease [Ignatzschineria larvae DSM 13226]|uniref:Restriction endonuclease n=1 Tax=Ignatzschineria larvae DSM 13226 TaxID=1111732 RepID=A0ABZ3C316_9GAMM|nr:restriction endonuclease [Ignatzschineria larvae]